MVSYYEMVNEVESFRLGFDSSAQFETLREAVVALVAIVRESGQANSIVGSDGETYVVAIA
jgi:hypothetical protein